MPKDSLQECKIKKHKNLIPSRRMIIEYLKNFKKPASREELSFILNIEGEKQEEALNRRLRAMERDGQIIFTHRQCYIIPERINLLKGTVIGHRDGYGFLRVEGHKDDFYLSSDQMKNCIHGDKVLAHSFGRDRKDRREARIVRIIAPKTGHIVGRYFTTNAGIDFVVPKDNRFNFNIFIPLKEKKIIRMGSIVVVKLIQRPTRHTKATGKIVEILGENMGVNMAVDIALRTYEIPYIWPKAVREQIKEFKEEVLEESKVGRVDLRNLPLFTIDGEDSQDFDDAIYCEKKKKGGWRLWVAIADVSYYVRPHTPINQEAQNRGTSIYFPFQVVPMLPEILSNNLCSLNPKVDRLCMVCEMNISDNGLLQNYNFYEAVMSSHARLTYTKVWHILKGNQKLREQYASLVKYIEELYNLYKVLNRARKERGGILFEGEEVKFIFNADRRIERIEQAYRNDAHKLIEECMILANISAARFVEKAKEPALFRIHDKPSIESITAFRSVLAEMGLVLTGGKQPETRDYANLLKSISNRPEYEMLQTMLLRSMKQAIYDPENHGHFGLALQSYAHFTSPIRRYPDLLLHRSIKYLLGLEKDKAIAGKSTVTGGWRSSMKEMLQLGHHCSMVERRAEEATREVEDWLKCDFMANQVGNIFKGIISNVIGFGFFVRLDELFIEGLVHISSLDNDYYRFDQIGHRLIGESSGQIYRLGDRVIIRVEAVNTDGNKIDFHLISNERTPYRKSNFT